MKELQVGRRVIALHPTKHRKAKGKIIALGSTWCTIEFDEYVDGHDAGMEGKWGHCWHIYHKDVEVDLPSTNQEASQWLKKH